MKSFLSPDAGVALLLTCLFKRRICGALGLQMIDVWKLLLMTALNTGKYYKLNLLFLCYTMLQSHAAISLLEQTG